VSRSSDTRVRPWRALRFRLPATAIIVFAISLAVAALLSFELLLRDSQRDIDVIMDREQDRFERSMLELVEEAQTAAPGLAPRDALESAVRRFLELNPSTDSYWTIVTFEDGTRLASSTGPPQLEELFRARELPAGEPEVRQTIDAGPQAGEIRTISVPILLDGEEAASLQIVAPLGPERAEAREAAWLLAAATGFALLLGAILLTASLWRSLTPLVELARAARSTELRALDRRVAEPETEDEVGVLAREFNTMLDRLDQATRTQQQFMASIGHELRTPITIARGHLELLQTLGPQDGAALDDTVGIVRDELGRMGRLVEDLMAIARSDMEDFVRPRALDLVGWFEEIELKLGGSPAGEDVTILPPPPVTVQADPDRLAQAVLNLIANAHAHTPADTPIRLRATARAEELVLVVEDRGPGIDPSIRDDVFAPFVRAGTAPGSTGLGLSVVKAVVDAHGGRIEVDTSTAGTRIGLVLPNRPDPEDPAAVTGADGAPPIDGRSMPSDGAAAGDPQDPARTTLRLARDTRDAQTTLPMHRRR
jgi:two-component system, OmpR family, sensor kinase